MIDGNKISALVMERQHFTKKADKTEYDKLFSYMSPMPTVYWCAPGCPPSMYFRSAFNDYDYNEVRRSRREIIKGRFQGGSIGYIESKELELFAGLYRKDTELKFEHMKLLELIEREGPMNIGLIKEITGLLVKQITPILHKLQEMFLVYEDQVDSEGDRGWYFFESEFSDVDIKKYTRTQALQIVIPRFAWLNVFFDAEMIKSFYKLPTKDISAALKELVQSGELIEIEVQDRKGFMLKTDLDILSTTSVEVQSSIYILHRNDFLVKSYEHTLKSSFVNEDFNVLHYVLINGKFRGALFGKFSFGPWVVEEILFDAQESEIEEIKDEIINAIYEIYDSSESPIRSWRYI